MEMSSSWQLSSSQVAVKPEDRAAFATDFNIWKLDTQRKALYLCLT